MNIEISRKPRKSIAKLFCLWKSQEVIVSTNISLTAVFKSFNNL